MQAIPARRRSLTLLISLMVFLGVVSTPAQGAFGVRLQFEGTQQQYSGTSETGFDHESSCPKGMVVTQVSATWNDYLSSVTIDCRAFQMPASDLQATGAMEGQLPMGATGTNSGTYACPSGQAVVGFESQIGAIFDGTRPICQGFSGTAPSGALTTGSLLGGSGGGTYSDSCTAGQVVTGLAVDDVAFSGPNNFGTLSWDCSSIIAGSEGDYQPDLSIDGAGEDVYNIDPIVTASKKVGAGKTAVFKVSVGNDGDEVDPMWLDGSNAKRPFKVRYVATGTPGGDVLKGSYQDTIDPAMVGAPVTIKIKAAKTAKRGAKATVVLTATSDSGAASDMLAVKVTAK